MDFTLGNARLGQSLSRTPACRETFEEQLNQDHQETKSRERRAGVDPEVQEASARDGSELGCAGVGGCSMEITTVPRCIPASWGKTCGEVSGAQDEGHPSSAITYSLLLTHVIYP